jgi:hypothetical protein
MTKSYWQECYHTGRIEEIDWVCRRVCEPLDCLFAKLDLQAVG